MNRREFFLVTISSVISAGLVVTFQDLFLPKYSRNPPSDANVSIYYRTENESIVSILILNDSDESIDIKEIYLDGGIEDFGGTFGALLLPSVTFAISAEAPTPETSINIDEDGTISITATVLISIPPGGRELINFKIENPDAQVIRIRNASATTLENSKFSSREGY